jgi:hypothetical protein
LIAVEPTEVLEQVKARGWTVRRSSRWSRRWSLGRLEADIDHERLGVAMASGSG